MVSSSVCSIPRPSGFEAARARLARGGRRLRRQGHDRRRRQQHGRGQSGRLADDHARRPHRRDRPDRPVHRRRRLRLSVADRRMGSAGARRPAHPLPRQRRRRPRRRRQEADPPHEGGGPRPRVEDDRPLGRHRRLEPRRGRRTHQRRRPGVIDSKTIDFPNNRIVSRSIDDRIGAFIVLEALRRYAQNPGAARVVAAATTQEEIAWHGGGALVCTNCINPQMAIVVDVTFATDHPNIEKKEIGDHRIGGGPVLSRGALISPVVFELLRDTAERHGIKYSVHAAGRDTSTNADAIHIAREGVATGARVDPEPLHAFAERAGEPRRRRQDGDAARRRVPRGDAEDRLHGALSPGRAMSSFARVRTLADRLRGRAARPSAVAPVSLAPDSLLIRRDIEYLASPALAGRMTGTPGNDSAAAYLARRYAAIGSSAAVPGYLQRFDARPPAHNGAMVSLPTQNVFGVVRGTDPALRNEYIVVGAHFDHLGANTDVRADPARSRLATRRGRQRVRQRRGARAGAVDRAHANEAFGDLRAFLRRRRRNARLDVHGRAHARAGRQRRCDAQLRHGRPDEAMTG